jgi:hypothetical protein
MMGCRCRRPKGRNPVLRFALLCAALLAATQASARYEYYVVQDQSTKLCTVVDAMPRRAPFIVVGDGSVHRTKEAAQTAMRLSKECKL